MSNRLGNPQSILQAAKATGGAGGVVISLGGSANQWLVLVSILATYVASATVGNRIIVVQAKDASGNVLWSVTQGTAVTAGQTVLVGLGGGVPASNQAVPLHQFMPIPDGFTVPANGTITIFDNANISATDTVAANIVASN